MNEKLTLKKKVVATLNEDQLGSVNGATTWPCMYIASAAIYAIAFSADCTAGATCDPPSNACQTGPVGCPNPGELTY